MLHVISELFIQDGLSDHPDIPEVAESRDKSRAQLLRLLGYKNETGYDSTEELGSSNDDFGIPHSEAPLPFIPPTDQTDEGYIGLDPPMG